MNIFERVQRILLQPKTEWYVIQQEPTYPSQLYTGYIMPLAAIGPVCTIIGLLLFGSSAFTALGLSLPIVPIIVGAVVQYVLALGLVYVMALIIDALAPTFMGQKQIYQALKLYAYSATPAWLGGIFSLIPQLAILGVIIALYSLYLLYLGLPVMMQSPPDKSIGYIVTIIVVAIVISVIIGVIVGAVTTAMFRASFGL
jgi:hypothetical protein